MTMHYKPLFSARQNALGASEIPIHWENAGLQDAYGQLNVEMDKREPTYWPTPISGGWWPQGSSADEERGRQAILDFVKANYLVGSWDIGGAVLEIERVVNFLWLLAQAGGSTEGEVYEEEEGGSSEEEGGYGEGEVYEEEEGGYGEEEEFVGPTYDPDYEDEGEEEAQIDLRVIDTALQALALAFPLHPTDNTDIYNTLVHSIEITEDSIGIALEVSQVELALNLFKTLGFASYMPNELSVCVWLVGNNAFEQISTEIDLMLTTDTQENSICSKRNRNIIKAKFGAEAMAQFNAFCAAAPESRVIEFENNSKNLATTLGIDVTAFEAYILEVFDTNMSDNFARQGAEALRQLIKDAIEQDKKDKGSVFRAPPTTLASGFFKEASVGSKVAVFSSLAAVAVGATMLVRKLNRF